MYTLRPYQQEATDRSIKFLTNGGDKNGIIVLPTGSGKSLIIAAIAQALGKLLIFQPRKEILEQNREKLHAYGIGCSVYSASFGSKQIGEITLATIGSVKSLPHLFEQFPYILIDECHLVNAKKGMYKEFLEAVPSKVLGLTATPYRLKSSRDYGSILRFLTRSRPKVFHEVVYHAQIADLIKDGYLAALKYYNIDAAKTASLDVNTTGTDYTEKSVKRHYEEIDFAGTLLSIVNRLIVAGRKHILVFTRFTEEAASLVANLDVPAAIVTAKTPKRERERILAQFKAGEIQVIANVGILTIGFDFPALDTIVLARPTRSLALYYQMIGRGIRPYPNKDGWVIDLCQTVELFGHVSDLWMTKPNRDRFDLWHIESRGRQLTRQLTDTYF